MLHGCVVGPSRAGMAICRKEKDVSRFRLGDIIVFRDVHGRRRRARLTGHDPETGMLTMKDLDGKHRAVREDRVIRVERSDPGQIPLWGEDEE